VEIKVAFNDSQLARYRAGKGQLLFEVTMQDGSTEYPMPHWSDFGYVVLGWWHNAIIQLIEGEKESEFDFMDGPYCVKARHNKKNGEVQLIPLDESAQEEGIIWTTTITELTTQLIQALDKACQELKRRQLGEREQGFMKEAILSLKSYLARIEHVKI
jgi:hypothetical protein